MWNLPQQNKCRMPWTRWDPEEKGAVKIRSLSEEGACRFQLRGSTLTFAERNEIIAQKWKTIRCGNDGSQPVDIAEEVAADNVDIRRKKAMAKARQRQRQRRS